MSRLILLFLSIPFVFSAESKCPKNFVRVSREPTVKNNHTSEWCFAIFPIFPLARTASRDYARGMCANYNSTLSIPETLDEFQVVSYRSKHVKESIGRKFNKTIRYLYIAVDGEFTPKCKKTMIRDKRFNPKEDKGECGLHQNLFSFDDSNSDPTFALNHNIDGYPNGSEESSVGDVTIKMYASCLAMDPDTYDSAEFNHKDIKNHTLDEGHFHLTWCDGKNAELFNLYAVLCGRPPL